jgi:hypothetical protein
VRSGDEEGEMAHLKLIMSFWKRKGGFRSRLRRFLGSGVEPAEEGVERNQRDSVDRKQHEKRKRNRVASLF